MRKDVGGEHTKKRELRHQGVDEYSLQNKRDQIWRQRGETFLLCFCFRQSCYVAQDSLRSGGITGPCHRVQEKTFHKDLGQPQ